MGMVPSYKTNEWQVLERRTVVPAVPGGLANATTSIQIRVLEGEEWRDYWIPNDPANTDYGQYMEWLEVPGNEPRIIF